MSHEAVITNVWQYPRAVRVEAMCLETGRTAWRWAGSIGEAALLAVSALNPAVCLDADQESHWVGHEPCIWLVGPRCKLRKLSAALKKARAGDTIFVRSAHSERLS